MNSLSIAFSLLVLSSWASAQTITTDTVWQGEVVIAEDLLVPAGMKLVIKPGTIIAVMPSESTKIEPEYLSPLTEIAVRGALIVEGTDEAPVVFRSGKEAKAPAWAGIIVDGGNATIRSALISHADTGIYVVNGTLDMQGSTLSKNGYGIVAHGHQSAAKIASSRVSENEYGIVQLNGASIESWNVRLDGNRKKNAYTAAARDIHPPLRAHVRERRDHSRVHGDEVLRGTVLWQNHIEVRGVVRVPEGSRLVILPGTIIEFRKNDTNGDGIGENGFLVQGAFIAKGTTEQPIIFRSAEKQRRPGDWDAINIMSSDTAQNLIEHCQIEDAYRGLHFHFSNVAVTDSVIRNNYRGIQFQESVVSVRGTHIYQNRSGVQARDSEILFTDNLVYRNFSGMNLLRNNISFTRNLVLNNTHDGLRMREGLPVVEGNLFDGNRFGLLVSDGRYGSYMANVISHNLESGFAARSTDGIEISGNAVQANGINGLSFHDASAVVKNNLISDNGDRGIGILSFQGIITANTIVRNRLYNLGIEGDADVSAPGNWWGAGDVKKTIYDKENDPAKGRAAYLPALAEPLPFAWPQRSIRSDTMWHDSILVSGTVIVEPGSALTLSPSTRVLFAKNAGLTVRGAIRALGEPNGPISFAAAAGVGAGLWDEILLDHAGGSVFSHCTFANATWAVHSHFTDLRVDSCSFVNNTGGLRFTSGPIEITRSLFERNDIGIRDYRGTARITGSRVTANRIGIFVREKGGGLSVRSSDLSGNSEYAIRLGDFNDEDVDARENWWGPGGPAATVYDGRSEPGIGLVRFEPAAHMPFFTVPGSAVKKAREAGDQ